MKKIALLLAILLSGCNSNEVISINNGHNSVLSTGAIAPSINEMIVKETSKLYDCTSPSVLSSSTVKYSPWDTKKNPPVLTGPIKELWQLDACGTKLEMFVVVTPVEDDSGRFMIGGAFKELP